MEYCHGAPPAPGPKPADEASKASFSWGAAKKEGCDQGHGPMVADWELDDDGKETGVALWVCPTCCWSLPRENLGGGA